MIGMPVGTRSVPWDTAASLIGTFRACDRGHLPIRICAPAGSSVVTWARSAIVGEFLKSDCTHLFWIDSDICWRPADFLRLVGFGAIYPIIGAAYPLKRMPPAIVVNTPEAENLEVDGHGNVHVVSLPLGFACVQRAVIEKIAATKPIGRDAVSKVEFPDFFRISRRESGELLGEDIAFFEDAAVQGFGAWLDPSIVLGHVGQHVFTGNPIEALGLEAFTKEIKE